MTPFRVVFMGTPEFAVASLDILHGSEIDICAVVTVPDKPAGRGQKLSESAVKKYALEKQIPILQPISLKDPEFLQQLEQFKAQLFVVVAFRMLPKVVWQMPEKGTINLHASLLPRYRGAAPINRAIMNGDTITGITTFFINEDIDTGKIIDFKQVEIGFEENVGQLYEKLKNLGSDLLLQTVRSIRDNTYNETSQEAFIIPDQELPLAPKIHKSDCEINWTHKAEAIYNQIRGLSPYPSAYTRFNINNKIQSVKIINAGYIDGRHKSKAGTLATDGKSYLYVMADGGIIDVKELQPEGKKAMKIKEFLAGVKSISEVEI